jgi:hypothetical protein
MFKSILLLNDIYQVRKVGPWRSPTEEHVRALNAVEDVLSEALMSLGRLFFGSFMG